MQIKEKFLKDVARYLMNKYGNTITDLTLVFPGRRAGLYFQRYIQEVLKDPILAPSIVTINEFVTGECSLRVPENITLLVRLYKKYRRLINPKESLDDFVYRGELLLNDFNDIDKYLVDYKQLFQNILDLKEIEEVFGVYSEEQMNILSKFWEHINLSNDTIYKKQFLDLWKGLPELYQSFKKELLDDGLAYEGLLYREVLNSLEEDGGAFQEVCPVFIGFNALNTAEKRLFKYLKNNNSALFFWDYDTYYAHSPKQEAGWFIRENLTLFPMPDNFSFKDDNFIQKDQVDLLAVSSSLGQAAYVNEYLKRAEVQKGAQFDSTAIVLCNEDLLLPVVENLYGVEEVNVTMGYSLGETVSFGLVKDISFLNKVSREKEGVREYYYKHLFSLMSNSLVAEYAKDGIKGFKDYVVRNNIVYVSRDYFDDEILSAILNLPNSVLGYAEYFSELINLFLSKMKSLSGDSVLMTGLLALRRIVNQLHLEFENGGGDEISNQVYFLTLLRYMQNARIPFDGEPLKGIQVMGFLETRCLDFDNVLLLSVNDDMLPGKSSFNSLIPYGLRKGFGLPVIEQKNAMYCYYFYRLLQRAKNVSILYDARSEGVNSGEVSRYVTQLVYEEPFLLSRQDLILGFDSVEGKGIEIAKNDEMLRKLEARFAEKPLSPTALSTWIDCRLHFYYKYVEGVEEDKTVNEEIDALLFGRIAHEALEELYKPFMGEVITSAKVQEIRGNELMLQKVLQKALLNNMSRQLKGEDDLNGKNRLAFEVVRRYVLKVLESDQQYAPFVLKGLESAFYSTIDFENEKGKWSVRYGGIVDRVDEKEGQLRIVDYKTGKSENDVKSIERLFVASSTRNKAAFQTLMYCQVYHESEDRDVILIPAVYGVRKVFVNDFTPHFIDAKKQVLKYQDVKDEFGEGFKDLIAQVFDEQIPFEQTNDDRTCTYCPYRLICQKGEG